MYTVHLTQDPSEAGFIHASSNRLFPKSARTEVGRFRLCAIIVFFLAFAELLYKQKSATTLTVEFLPRKERQKKRRNCMKHKTEVYTVRVPDDSERNEGPRGEI